MLLITSHFIARRTGRYHDRIPVGRMRPALVMIGQWFVFPLGRRVHLMAIVVCGGHLSGTDRLTHLGIEAFQQRS
jgi:hypothetical protein